MSPRHPLAQQLRDIHLPEPPGWWPPAPGWWLLSGLLLGAALCLAWHLRRRWLRQAFRRQGRALVECEYREWLSHGDGQRYAQRVNSVLKRTAMLCYPGAGVAGLSGARWLRFLDGCLGEARTRLRFGDGPLAWAPYSPPRNWDVRELHETALAWLREHGARRPGLVSRAPRAGR